MSQLFFDSRDASEGQSALDLDDGGGLRVVDAKFVSEEKFSWNLFDGYDKIRILTYSAGISAIVRLLNKHNFIDFECVFGCENTLRTFKDIMAFQQVAISDTRAAIKGLKDKRHAFILNRVREGQARFRVLRTAIAHSKLYLLENATDGNKRAIIGSANLSETAFGGRQSETLVKFDNDESAWSHYLRMYQKIRDSASDNIPLPADRIQKAAIQLHEIPALNANDHATLVIDSPDSSESLSISVSSQIEKIEKVKADIPAVVSAVIPSFRNRQQKITPEIKREIRRENSRVRLVQSDEEVESRYFSINRTECTAEMSGDPFSLESDPAQVKTDARLLVDYFGNYRETFEGDVKRLQRDYFILWSWLYFSPFMCDMRNLAGAMGDIFRYPSFAIVYGKPSCGKSSLVDTLITSMFGREHRVDKGDFTRSKLRGLQQNYKRFPVVFDDVGKRAVRDHGTDIIKDENPPPVEEYPCFILSMNNELKAFPDEIVKRSMMIYTTTALPSYKEDLRHTLHLHIQQVRRELSGHLYRLYLSKVIERLKDDRLPNDWLAFSSSVISEIVAANIEERPPEWCQPVAWSEYASKRHDKVKAQLQHLLRPSAKIKKEGDARSGWMLEGDKVIVVEPTDQFGRREFDWENVPSTLIDENASVGGRTVLNRRELEDDFLGFRLRRRSRWVRKLLG